MTATEKTWMPMSKAQRISCYALPPLGFAAVYLTTLVQFYTSLSNSASNKYLDMMTTQLSQVNFELATKITESGLSAACTHATAAIVTEEKAPALTEFKNFDAEPYKKRQTRDPLLGEIFFFPQKGQSVTSYCRIQETARGFATFSRFYQDVKSLADQGTFLSNASGELLLMPPGVETTNKALFAEIYSYYAKTGLRNGSNIIEIRTGESEATRVFLVFKEIPKTNLVLFRTAPASKLSEHVLKEIKKTAVNGLVTMLVMSILWVAIWALFSTRMIRVTEET
jgi:hypothetical protein